MCPGDVLEYCAIDGIEIEDDLEAQDGLRDQRGGSRKTPREGRVKSPLPKTGYYSTQPKSIRGEGTSRIYVGIVLRG